MKLKIILLSIICLTASLAFAQQKLTIDIKNSVVNWTGHAEIGSYAPAGTLNFKEGQIILKNGLVNSALLLIDMKTMQQSNNDLLGHLKGPDFFDVEKYTLSTIRITRVVNGQAYGQLTIKDNTQPLICPVDIQTANGRITISGKIIIDRTKYGVVYNSSSFFANLGDHAIRNTFDVAFSVVGPQ
ncbi:YceI family protein [Mucilaginibacter glaciei]|uniref:YceI family protein n=1 Tax=Mucilaginibacter glaciei TaxID=2772109 RepID=A0A926NRC1_9SPHI|nr:YceI family protein [Mucilaginibacter glaciei]MBD1393948.1 YceI family protein [Mucilaginibacter glaciei]